MYRAGLAWRRTSSRPKRGFSPMGDSRSWGTCRRCRNVQSGSGADEENTGRQSFAPVRHQWRCEVLYEVYQVPREKRSRLVLPKSIHITHDCRTFRASSGVCQTEAHWASSHRSLVQRQDMLLRRRSFGVIKVENDIPFTSSLSHPALT
jgi:hypothetical protein